MTTHESILEILESHKRKIQQVELENVKDCSAFWNELASYAFYNIPQDESGMDCKVESAMHSFANVDSLELVNKAGRILKRFGKHFKTEHGIKLPDNIQGLIGDRLQYFIQKEKSTFYADFIDVIDWADGKFGKGGSCWWGTYGASREVFTDNGGWGMRFYDDMNDTYGIGRTWILPKDGMLFCFNSYGVSRAKTSKVLKAIFAEHGIKLHYKQIEIENSQNSEIPYINGDTGFVMYPDDMDANDVPDDYDLDMYVEDDREICANCHSRRDSDNGTWVHEEFYCESCTSELFSFCDACNEYCDTNDVHEVRGSRNYSYLCEYCASHHDFVLCSDCDLYSQEYIVTEDTNKNFCDRCQDDNAYYCESCEEWNSEEHNHEDESDEQNTSSEDAEEILDTTGLIEQQEMVHIQWKGIKYYTVTVYRVPDVTGIFLYKMSQVDSDYSTWWAITHEESGLAIKSDIQSFDKAKELFLALAPMAYWNQPASEITSNAELCGRVSSKIREIL